jgi:Flp pilus assembly protein TadD
MSRGLVVKLVVLAMAIAGLVASLRHSRRPGYESHITGDAGVRAGIELSRSGHHAEAIEVIEREGAKPLLEVPMESYTAALGASYEALGAETGDDAKKATGLHYTGMAQKLRGELVPAEASFLRALELQPDHGRALASLGSLYLQLGRNEEAIARLERAADVDATVAITRSNLALAYALTGRFDSAEVQLQAASRLGYTKIEAMRQKVNELRASAGRS